MDPEFAERKRRYEQQILDALNTRPERFVQPRASAVLPDWQKWRMKAGNPRAHRALPHHAASGAELEWHVVVPDVPVVGSQNHTFVRLTPENGGAYKYDRQFQHFDEFGRRYATLGAGPSSLVGIPFGEAHLASFANQEKDVAPHPQGIPIKPPSGMSVDEYIDLLLKLDEGYPDDLWYEIYPDDGHAVGARAPVYVEPGT